MYQILFYLKIFQLYGVAEKGKGSCYFFLHILYYLEVLGHLSCNSCTNRWVISLYLFKSPFSYLWYEGVWQEFFLKSLSTYRALGEMNRYKVREFYPKHFEGVFWLFFVGNNNIHLSHIYLSRTFFFHCFSIQSHFPVLSVFYWYYNNQKIL